MPRYDYDITGSIMIKGYPSLLATMVAVGPEERTLKTITHSR